MLTTIIFFTKNMEKLADFYKKCFDLGEFQSSPGHTGIQLENIYLGFDEAPADYPEPVSGGSVWFAVDDIEAAYQKMLDNGATPRNPPAKKPWGGTIGSVYDPDGNILGVSLKQ